MSRLSAESEELLTGLIDGQLSNSERQAVEDLLATNPDARKFLSGLEQMRSALSAVPTVSTPRFKASITAQALARATELGSNTPWLKQVDLVVPQQAPASDWWNLRTAILAMAASLSFLLIGGVWYLRSNESVAPINQLLADNRDIASPNIAMDGSDSKAIDPLQNALSSEATIRLQNDSVAMIPALPEGSAPTPERVDLPQNPPKDNSLASSSEIQRQNSVDAPTVSQPVNPEPSVEQSMAATLPNEPDIDPLMSEFGNFLVIVDLTLSKDIDSIEVLNNILAQHDIASGEDLNVDAKVAESLEKSRLVDDVVSEQRRQQAVESTSFVFVKARAARIDAAILEMIQDVEAFPEFSFDIAFDAPSLELFDELRTVQEAELSDAEKREPVVSIASPLRRKDVADSFIAPSRRQPSMPRESRLNSSGPSFPNITGEAANPVSYVLFVLRTPK